MTELKTIFLEVKGSLVTHRLQIGSKKGQAQLIERERFYD